MESGRSLPRKVTSELRRSSRSARKTKDVVKADLPEVLITGCRDTQTSADAFINGRYNGALTFALVEAMRKGKAALTYKQLHDRAAVVYSRPGNSSRCLSSKAGPPGSIRRCFPREV